MVSPASQPFTDLITKDLDLEAETAAALPSTSSTFPLTSSTSSQPGALSASTSTQPAPGAPPSSTAQSSNAAPALVTPPELESTLAMLSSHRTVLGYLLLSRPSSSSASTSTSQGHSHSHSIPSFESVRIIRSSGVVFEGESGKRYAGAVGRIVDAVTRGLADVSGENGGSGDSVSIVIDCAL